MRTWLQCLALIVAVHCSGAAFADDEAMRYRVSGLVITEEKRLAFIERSDGTQSLYRPGDRIEAFTVAAVDSGGVELSGPRGTVFLPLRGEPTDLSDVRAVARTRDLQVVDRKTTASLDYGSALEGIVSLRSEVAELARVTEAPETLVKRREEIARRFNRVLGLPPHSTVRAIDRRRVGSVEEALLVIGQPLQDRRSIRLEVDGVPGVEVIYATPDGA